MKVAVTQGIRVVHDGRMYQYGQRVDVGERVARQWITYVWASESGAQSLPDARGLAGHPAPWMMRQRWSRTPSRNR